MTLSYPGVNGKIKNASVTDYSDGYPYLASSLDPDLNRILTSSTVFTLPAPGTNDTSAIDLPTVVFLLAMGSSIARVDIVPKNLQGVRRIVGQQAIGPMQGFPMYYQHRNSLVHVTWD